MDVANGPDWPGGSLFAGLQLFQVWYSLATGHLGKYTQTLVLGRVSWSVALGSSFIESRSWRSAEYAAFSTGQPVFYE